MASPSLTRRTLLFGAASCTVAGAANGARMTKAETRRTAWLDSKFSARIVGRRKLMYRAGADAELDRPSHVRAASGIAWLGDRLAVVQDDANFIALIDPKSNLVEAVTLPAGPAGKRVFDDSRGTKNQKTDLEACLSIVRATSSELFAFGSGSKTVRERIVVIKFDHAKRKVTSQRVIDASTLYETLRAADNFGGSELNIEGAVRREDDLLLFQRGNGAPTNGKRPPSAVGHLRWSEFLAYVDANGKAPPPALERVTVYDLGRTGRVPFTFTDATLTPKGSILFLACAEDSSSTVTDGDVLGMYVGELRKDGNARLGRLLDEQGKPSKLKAEGIALDFTDSQRAWIAVDLDDAATPSELLEVRLAPL